VSVAGPSMLQVQVWDRSLVKACEIAIRDSSLSLNPQSEGQTIRVNLPPLTEQRRVELAKQAAKYSEGTKIAVRGVRRDGMEQIQGWKKKSEIGEDEAKRWSDEVQKLTDDYVKQIDVALAAKEKDIKTV
ncbi:MAG TPA: ribosome-recycling factor, partial [Roseococcus sp.]|nr:ribosome-recycling factor [Roseococcus sp.]